MRNRAAQTGSVLIFVVLLGLSLMGMAALAVDIGMLVFQQRSIQLAADLAATAGAQHLPESPAKAIDVTRQYLLLNGVQNSEITNINLSTGKTEIKVRVNRTVDLYFGRVLGYASAAIEAKSTAVVHGVSQVTRLVPWGQEVQQNFVYGQEYVLKWGPSSSSEPLRGNYHIVDLSGSMSTQEYQNWVANDYTGSTIRVGQWINTKTGTLGKATEDGVNERKKRAAGYNCSLPNPDPSCPLIVVAPIVKSFVDINGSGSVRVEGFARFLITRVVAETSSNVTVYGVFLVRLETDAVDPKAGVFGMKRVFLRQ